MVRALEGGPIASKADRLAAYQRIGISFEGISAEEVDKADQEAYSITLLKRFA